MVHTRNRGRTIGVNFNEEGNAEIVVYAPLKDKVAIVLTESHEQIALTKDEFGWWRGTSDKIKNGTRYKVLVNDKQLPDPASLSQPEGVHGASQAVDLHTFNWSDDEWNNIPLEDYLIYELHTGTFTPEGTFEAIEDKLDYLKELGVTAIEIMPVAQFPGERNWGYDGVFPFAVQHSYGGNAGLMHLVQACHSKGIAVVLDVVYNHLGPEGNYLGEFAPYFTDKYKTPWGNAVNFDDEWCDGVRQYFVENALMWFRDFHIDALRLDAVHAIKDFSPTHILKEIKLEVNKLMAATGRTHHLIVELDLNDNKFINPLEQHGYGMDAQWLDEFHHALRVTTGQERSGYYADFNGLKHLAKAYKDAYVFDGIYSPHRKRTFGAKAENNDGKQFIVFSQNHDQIGNRMLGERIGTLLSFELQKLVAACVLVSPYLPMLFMGEEYGETNPFLYFVSHTDEALAEAVRKGRKEEFAAFHAQGEAPDPMDVKTFEQSKLQWQLPDEGQHAAMLRFYKDLISLRKQEAALRVLNRNHVIVEENEQEQTLLLHRWHEDEHIVSLMNFSKEQREMKLPVNMQWRLLLDSSVFTPNPSSKQRRIENGSVHVQPESVALFKNSIPS